MKKLKIFHSKALLNRKKLSVRSQSEIITTVLLILIVITSIVIVMNFVIPFVKDQLSGSDCFSVVDKIAITDNDMYTCYDYSAKNLSVQIHLGDIADKINGFSISAGGASTGTYTIKNGTNVSGVTMYGGSINLIIPGKNEERTYIIGNINTKPDNLKVYPILKDGRVCDSASGINSINLCGTV